MGFLECLTLIFVVLKLIGTITWSWFWVLSPVIFSFILYFIFIVFLFFSKRRFKATLRKRRRQISS